MIHSREKLGLKLSYIINKGNEKRSKKDWSYRLPEDRKDLFTYLEKNMWDDSVDLEDEDIITDFKNTVESYINMGRYSEAQKILQHDKIISYTKKNKEKDISIQLELLRANMFIILVNNQDAEKIIGDIEEEIMRKKQKNPTHPIVLMMFKDLANLYWKIGRSEDSLNYFKEISELELLKNLHIQSAITLYKIAFIHMENTHYSTSKDLLDKALGRFGPSKLHPAFLKIKGLMVLTEFHLGFKEENQMIDELWRIIRDQRKAAEKKFNPDMIFLMENLADHLSKNKHSRKDALELYITIKAMRTYFYGTKNHPEVEKIQKKILISNISGNSDMLQYIELLVIQANIYRIHGKDIYSKTFEEIKNSIKRFKDHSDRKYIDILDLMEKALGSHDNSLFEDLKKIKEYHWGKEIQTIIEDLEESPINQLELKNIRLSWEKLLEESPELQRESKKIMDMIKGILQKLIERIISLFK